MSLGVNGLSTLTIQPLNAGDTPIEWLNVTAVYSGTNQRRLAVSVSCPDYHSKRVSYIKSAQRSGGDRPVIFSCDRIGQIGVSNTSTSFSFSSYGAMIVTKDATEGYSGNIYANIVATATPSGMTGASGAFEDSQTVQGDFLGSISTPLYVNALVVTGALGTSSRPASITAAQIGRIDGASFNGVINATGTASTTGIGQFTITTGDAIGTITAQRIGTVNGWPGVWTIGGDLDANVVIRGDVDAEATASPAAVVVGDEFKAGRYFTIGGSLAGGASGVGGLKVAASGLKGQVIVNDTNGSALWLGDVTVGSTVLDPGSSGANPVYGSTSASLGGGAVGLVRFRLHPADCTQPDPGDSVLTMLNSEFCQLLTSGNRSITLAFYGDIRTDSVTDLPVIVTRDVTPSEPPVTSLVATLKRGTGSTYSRQLTLSGDGVHLLQAGTYHITPVTTGTAKLVCDHLPSASPNVASFDFEFVLTGDCDLNGVADTEDIDNNFLRDLWPMNDVLDSCETCTIDLNCDSASNGLDVEIEELAVGGDYTDFCWPHGYADLNGDFALNGNDVSWAESAVGGYCPN